MSLDQIRESIDARLAELNREIATLQAARAALQAKSATEGATAAPATRASAPRRRRAVKAAGNGHGPDHVMAPEPATPPEPVKPPKVVEAAETAESATTPVATPSKPPRTRTRSSKPRKSVEVLLAGRLEAMLADADDGLSAATISKRANAGYNQVRDLLHALESAGQVRRTGSRQTSLWRLITDEERIAERVAELERLSVAKSDDPSRQT